MHQQDEYAALGSSAENKLRKVKLKVGGVTRTIHAKTDIESGEGSANRNKAKREYWFSNTGKGNTPEKYHTGSTSEPVRKSRRVPKRRSLDDDIDQDYEVRYLEKVRVSRAGPPPTTEFEDAEDEGSKKHKVLKVTNSNNNNNGDNKSVIRTSNYEVDEDFVVSRLGRDNNNCKRHKELDGGSLEGEEAGSDGGVDANLTSRQRAMRGKGGNGDSLIEFPNGLPPAPSRKQKEKLSEVEIQAKKAEAAQRRKMQVEKAAKEAEAEAIRKILGLDADKKKEEKKQEREEKVSIYVILGQQNILVP
ncbi:HIT zinc finger and PAPA-1-like domain-containing protein [Rhynchospora pubera]|uniref:HIT zinc finger and PAPA-1-like domain-containing protein n=1 Tax=Rhynchospora pubera TaxID=906938 RepID=A0AAV8HVE3_9POAL|nr:HIT zinc finger and PAPA-1-like domain-containing protein [Rhynchospora pubera]